MRDIGHGGRARARSVGVVQGARASRRVSERHAHAVTTPAIRWSSPSAMLAAECLMSCLYPETETFLPLQRQLNKRAALDLDGLPMFLPMLNSARRRDITDSGSFASCARRSRMTSTPPFSGRISHSRSS